MSYATEFGTDYAVPAWITELLRDTSWHNDACPSFTHSGWEDAEGVASLRVWVEHPETSRRELPLPRFCVASYDAEGNHTADLLMTESEEELREWLTRKLAEPVLAFVQEVHGQTVETVAEALPIVVQAAQREIREDFRNGIHPDDVKTFSELHNHVDANEYGGFCRYSGDASALLPFAALVQETLSAWLEAGRP